jgi:energy-coupling factor transport system substrate-specific component
VSWQLGASALLVAALAGGFAWYERTRPDARVLALVATLAAFAALGRIAFAALPNVKPTTDIVLLSGFALGPAAGFVVGAVAGLTSNFFFGQGPWTFWQMVGWGVTGLIGAGVARLSGRRIARWPLALVCLVVGFAFTALQDVGDWVNFSDHSPAQLGIYVGKGVGFDAVHAVGCLIFALVFGPALVRSLERFVMRLEVRWQPASRTAASLLVLAAAFGALAGSAGTRAGAARAAASPTTYLLSAQNGDGGFGSAPGQASSQLFAGWAALGLAAEGYNPGQVLRDGHSLISYLRAGAGSASDPGSLERTLLAAGAAGANPHSFGGRDLVAALEARISRNGSVSDQTNLTAFGVLALRAAGALPPARTLAWLVAQEDRDGGFNYDTTGSPSDVDDTGAVLEALAGDSTARAVRARSRAVAFIERRQDSDGGFAASPGAGSNAQSTAWAVQGLIAAGTDPGALHRRGAPSPLAYLRSLITPDGHVRYARGSDQTPVWVTAEALMALAGKPLPLLVVPIRHAATRHPRTRAAGRVAKAVARPRRPRPSRRRAAPVRVPTGIAQRLASDAGILDALALAPIGIG